MKQSVENLSRRRLLKGRTASQKPALRLPWIINEQTFLEQCNQCGDCVPVCESKIITQDEFGFPFIDFSNDECTFCRKCIDVCSKPLFVTKAAIEDQKIPPWPATLTINDKCFAQNHIYCQSCQDVCDSAAIEFNFTQSSIPQPSINLNNCNQCGACISTCPQQAISLKLNNVIEVSHA